jgi:hypothetical protein
LRTRSCAGWRSQGPRPSSLRRARETATEALFVAMDNGGFDVDLSAIDRINGVS